MADLLTSAQMRAVEGAAIESGAVTGLALMERAGAGVVDALLRKWPEFTEGPRDAVVLCGPGNNGGDGYVIARRLKDRGWQVAVYALGDPADLPSDAKANYDLWVADAECRAMSEAVSDAGSRPDVLIDALFGTGLSRPVPAPAVDAFHAVCARARRGEGPLDSRIVAVDAPSGLDCDTGRLHAPGAPASRAPASERWRLEADLTVSFHAAKRGHYIEDGPGLCGTMVVHDIGISPQAPPDVSAPAPPAPNSLRLVERAQRREAQTPPQVWPEQTLPVSGPERHKYDRGHVFVLAGGVGRGGAGRLAARAALRVGAGLVTIGCPPGALQENAARLDAIMLRPLAGARDFTELLRDPRLSSVCLGPGLGVGGRIRDLVFAACGAVTTDKSDAASRHLVLDADALTSFEEDPEALFNRLHMRCILTPHEGEFARLFPDLSVAARASAALSKIDAACAAADRAGCTILLKGPDTVIASPGSHASLHSAAYDRAAPWLGTAGAGDVLAGLIAGLLAPRSTPNNPHAAAETAAWLHVEAARSFGPGLIAEDLPEELPRVFRAIGL